MTTEPGYPYPPDDTRTHWDGCWVERGHHNCAVQRVRELESEIREMEADDTCKCGYWDDIAQWRRQKAAEGREEP